jgi:predicted ATP-dependent endonuclease of OLD family
LLGKKFYYITAERNIVPEPETTVMEAKPNGDGITTIISTIINRAQYDSRIVQQKLLLEIVKIVQPDIELSAIIPQKLENNSWEIFFETEDETRIALSKMGSGIKTILQVLTNLIVLPVINNTKTSDCVFAFEELENNLHPAMQRRLFEYLATFTIANNTTLFITTHSNVVIDIFGNDADAQIVHIKKEGNVTVARSTNSFDSTKIVLKDLGIKASDILQSNGVIWVEGPSDRNYLNRWISLVNDKLQEGLHYSILPYGGRVLSNFCFDYDWLEKELIPLLKINTNAFVVIDKDGKTISDKLNTTKLRIQREIGEDNCWITKGREIENYLSKSTLEKWLAEKHTINATIEIDSQRKIEDILNTSMEKMPFKYDANKSMYSREITDFIQHENLEVLDLKHKINSLVAAIDNWNCK